MTVPKNHFNKSDDSVYIAIKIAIILFVISVIVIITILLPEILKLWNR